MENIKKYKVHIIWVIVAIIAFVGGMYYGKASIASSSFARSGAASSTRGFTSRTATSGGFVTGQILSKDAQSLTVQLPNGNSEVVFYSSSTSVSVVKPSSASVSDLTAGTEVRIGGTQNSDGSLTAQTIQVGGGAPGTGGAGQSGGGATSGQ